MNVSDFLRTHQLRSGNVMWLLGAGASASAGVPTARDMIWDFKRTLYCTAEGVSVRRCDDLADPTLRIRLQEWCDESGRFPTADDPEEYAAYFEATYPTERDRRSYIDLKVSGAAPGHAHLALAALLATDRARVVWTTNFDRLIEDSAAVVFEPTARLGVASLDNVDVAMDSLNEGRWPLLVKLHGDFQSRHLKNSTEELRKQDDKLRRALAEACKRFGLAIVGYSGRDASVMEALERAIEEGRGFPSGLYWFHRGPEPPVDRVVRLIEQASKAAIDAHLIALATFDELLNEVLLLVSDLPASIESKLRPKKRRVSDAPLPAPGKRWPVIRTNAFPISSSPTLARLVVCQIGGIRDVRDAVSKARASIIATRRKVGVLAFGSDSEVRRAFDPFGIADFTIHSIDERRLDYDDSAERGLLYEAPCRSIERELPINVQRRRSSYLLVADPERIADPAYHCLAEGGRTLREVFLAPTSRGQKPCYRRAAYRALVLGSVPYLVGTQPAAFLAARQSSGWASCREAFRASMTASDHAVGSAPPTHVLSHHPPSKPTRMKPNGLLAQLADV
jgi:NAD-dependent SIR2 family protein deacetylase